MSDGFNITNSQTNQQVHHDYGYQQDVENVDGVRHTRVEDLVQVIDEDLKKLHLSQHHNTCLQQTDACSVEVVLSRTTVHVAEHREQRSNLEDIFWCLALISEYFSGQIHTTKGTTVVLKKFILVSLYHIITSE